MFGEILSNDESLTYFSRAYIKFWGVTSIGSRIRAMHVFKELKKVRFRSVLEAGCGVGTYSLTLAKKNKNIQVLGVDLDINSIERAKAISKKCNIKNAKFKISNITTFEDNNSYDVLLLIDVLEHIADDKLALEKLYLLLEKGGHIIIHVPKKEDIVNSKSQNKLKFGHVRPGYTVDEIKTLLEKTGFEILTIKCTFGFFGHTAKNLSNKYSHDKLLFKEPSKITTFEKILFGFTFPFLLLLSYFDIFTKSGRGGILISAVKN